MRSASSESGINILTKAIYFYKLFKIRVNDDKRETIIPWRDIYEYESILAKYLPNEGQKLVDHRVLEIGYGARPWRLLSMVSMGINIQGIDLDRPTYGYNPKRLIGALKRNGFERFIKSFVRGLFFDRSDIRALKNELRAVNKNLTLDEKCMMVGNAKESHHFNPNSFTFAFSEDVFEHIPGEDIPHVLDNIKTWLQPGGIAVIRPNVWTGITGGHDPDYYPDEILAGRAPHTKAWMHLLQPDFKVNTYLNRLRLQDYVRLFSERFEILEVIQKHKQLGKEYLSADLLSQLSPDYSEEELLTNQISFVLRA